MKDAKMYAKIKKTTFANMAEMLLLASCKSEGGARKIVLEHPPQAETIRRLIVSCFCFVFSLLLFLGVFCPISKSRKKNSKYEVWHTERRGNARILLGLSLAIDYRLHQSFLFARALHEL